MKKVVIYFKGYCPYCQKALATLRETGVEFEEIDVTNDPETYAKVKEKSGSQTVPQLFVDDKFIGGCDEIDALKASGELNSTLGL